MSWPTWGEWGCIALIFAGSWLVLHTVGRTYDALHERQVRRNRKDRSR